MGSFSIHTRFPFSVHVDTCELTFSRKGGECQYASSEVEGFQFLYDAKIAGVQDISFCPEGHGKCLGNV